MSALPRRLVPAVLIAAAVIGSAPMVSTVGARQAPASRAMYRDGWIDFNKNGRKDRYEDPSVGLDHRLDDLLSQMTLEEKAAQLETRLGVPVDFTNEGIRGLAHWGATPFPTANRAFLIDRLRTEYGSDEKSGGDDGVRSVVNGVLYPFGHGLSYTTFRYANLQIAPTRQTIGGTVRVSVDITNTGRVAGDEVVQLYLRDFVSSVITYEQVLRGFERVAVAPGQTRTVTFTLGSDDLQLLDAQMHWVVEPGAFEIQVGSSSADVRLRDRFEIVR